MNIELIIFAGFFLGIVAFIWWGIYLGKKLERENYLEELLKSNNNNLDKLSKVTKQNEEVHSLTNDELNSRL